MPRRLILITACLLFFALGMIPAIIGPVLPALAHATSSTLTDVGGLISALFFGALVAQVICGPLIDHFGTRPVLLGGLVCIVFGVLGVLLSGSLIFLLSFGVLMGLGHGAVDIATNLLVAATYAEGSAVALNFTSVFFGLGAVASPAFASFTLNRWHSPLPAFWASGILSLALIPVLLLIVIPRQAAHGHADDAPRPQLYRSPLLWTLALIFLLYVGLENGVGGWIALYIQRTTLQSLSFGALIESSFWLALTGGRILATVFGSRITASNLLTVSLVSALLGTLLLVFSAGDIPITTVAVVLIGLSFGPVFPTALALTTARFPASPGRAAGVTVAAGSIGGVIIPWLQGLILVHKGPMFSTAFVAAGALAMLGIAILVRRMPAAA